MKERDNMRKKREKTWQRVVKVQREKPHFPQSYEKSQWNLLLPLHPNK